MSDGTVVLFSGGMDSAVALAWSVRALGRPVFALSLEYNQRHWIELEHARKVASILTDAGLGPDQCKTVTMGSAGTGLGSLLTAAKGGVIDSDERAVVPGRNLMMLIFASVVAQRRGYSRVVIGCNADDSRGFPDCREATLEAMGQAIRLGLDWPGKIVAPLLHMTKTDVAREAQRLGVVNAVRASWSCYQPVHRGGHMRCNDVYPCEKCPACVKRAHAFSEAGL